MDLARRHAGRLIVPLILILAGCNQKQLPVISMISDMGEIRLELYPEAAPVTVSNILSLVEEKAYDQAVFYRVVRMDNQPLNPVKIEVIQGGLFDDERIESHPGIRHETTAETGILHTDGVISMARMEPGSASTEFFICVGDQPSLDFKGKRNPDAQGFAAFGKVISGMEVVRAIQALPDEGQYLIEPVRIQRITRVR